jgi:PAS domain S-box-containing protein
MGIVRQVRENIIRSAPPNELPKMKPTESQPQQTWFWLGILAVIAIALIARWALHEERTSFLSLQHTYQRIVCADELWSNLTDDEAKALGYVLTGDRGYLRPQDTLAKVLDEQTDRLLELVQSNPLQREHVEELGPLIHHQTKEILETIRARDSAAFDTTQAGILIEHNTQLMDEIRRIISEMRNEEQTTLPQLLQRRRSRLRAGYVGIFGSAFLALCCLLFAETNLRKTIFRRQKAQEELRASEKRFEILCEQAPIGIYETDAQGQCVYANHWWSELSGLSLTESLGRGWQRAVHPNDLVEDWQAAALRGAWWEFRLLTTRGDVRWIRASGGPIYSPAGTLTGFVGTLENITERKAAERALRERDALNRAVLNSLPANIAVLNGDGIIQSTNEAWQRFAQANGPLSCSVDTGADYLEVCRRAADVGSQDAAKALAGIRDVLAGRLQSFEMQYPCHSPSEKRWYHMLVTPLAGVSGGGAAITHLDVTRRKRAEQRFRLAVEAAPSGMVMSASDGTIVLVNSRAEELFGYGRKELLGKSIETLLPEVARPRHPELRKEFLGEPQARPMGRGQEVSARRQDGTQFPVEVGLNPIETEEGTWILNSIVDITGRKRTEEALRESEERFRNMADTAPVMIWVAGPNKRCTFFNKTWLDFTGRTMEQEQGDGWAESVHPDDLDRCIATYSSSFEARRRFRMEYRLRRADREFRWVLDDGVPRFTPGGIFAGYIGSCIDITEERRAEEERQKFVSLADRSLEFIGMCDLEFRPFYINSAGMRLVGLDNLEAARRMKVQDYFFSEDQDFINNVFFPGVLREGHGEVEIRFRHFKTGDAIWMLLNVFGIFDTAGKHIGWATVNVDITKRKRVERELQESRQELRALAGRLINAEEEERKRISRELHDDLNQKLALLAFDTGSMLLTPPPSVETLADQLRSFQSRVIQLSQDVRQISHRLHSSVLEDLGLTAALNELCEELSAREEIEVLFEQESVPKNLPTDVAACLYRVAQEALHNVLKHAHASRATLKVSGSSQGIRLLIRDLGIGFNPEVGWPSHSLGIVSMKERIRLVQGEFSIHSHPGEGTEVRVFVPLPREVA